MSRSKRGGRRETLCCTRCACKRCQQDRQFKHRAGAVESPEELVADGGDYATDVAFTEQSGDYAAADAFFGIFGMKRGEP